MTATEKALKELQARWPDWEIWTVPCYIGPDIWSARRWGQPVAEVSGHSPAELDEYIAEFAPASDG